MKNPYEILGVSKGASDDEIKKAYKKLAKVYHPDKNKGNKSHEEKFKEIGDAYDKIKTKAARDEYEASQSGFDRAGASDRSYYQHFSGDGVDPSVFEEIFRSFGGSGMNFRQGPIRQDVTSEVEIDFWDAIKGGERVLNFSGGSSFSVNLPAGVNDGQKIRLKDLGERFSGVPGDLHLVVKVRPAKGVEREGNDLTVDWEVPIDVAVRGGEYLFSSPLGRFMLKLKPFTDSGTKQRLKGKGIKGGDLFARVKLVMPKDSKARKNLAERFHQDTHTAA